MDRYIGSRAMSISTCGSHFQGAHNITLSIPIILAFSLNYTYYKTCHRKRQVIYKTGSSSGVRNRNPIRAYGRPPRGALSQTKLKRIIISVT